MTITLNLTKEQEILLQQKADACGVDKRVVLKDIVEAALRFDQSLASKNPPTRVFDLHRDNIAYISKDFNDELPDSFWLGSD